MKRQVMVGSPTATYSEVMRFGDLLFVSGQVSDNPDTGELIPGDIEEQTTNAILNLKRHLEAAGSSLDNVIKCTIYLSKPELFDGMNKAYRKMFDPAKGAPARITTYGATLYGGMDVEIECIAGIED
ncbi:MAG: RidA family protein [Clostridia bacterium]|nr:RidA family protein [Clostridia bacterium]